MVRRCTLTLGFALAAALLAGRPVHSQMVPCDFKGIAIGDKLTREQVMERLGIKKFKLDPPRTSLIDMDAELEKYGITGAAEREDDKTGPYCREDYCNIPWGLFVGDDKIAVKVFVALKENVVYAIEISFNTIFWNDIWDILTRKYGQAWEIEKSPIGVMEIETKKVDTLDRVIVTHKFGGTNPSSKDTCSLSATNVDIVFRHHDIIGTVHGIFGIKRNSKDF
jgi:hypothetical protein